MTFLLDLLSFVLIESKINIFSTIKLKTGQKSAKNTYVVLTTRISSTTPRSLQPHDGLRNPRAIEHAQ